MLSAQFIDTERLIIVITNNEANGDKKICYIKSGYYSDYNEFY